MQVYIFKNNQQSGPYEETAVLEWLKNGQLSSEDLACRQGEKDWRPLKILFPNFTPAFQPPVVMPNQPAPAVAAKGGGSGCRGILGVLMLILGVLLFVGGLTGGGVSLAVSEPLSCTIADREQKDADEALKEYQQAKGTAREAELAKKVKDKLDSLEIWSKSCGDMKAYYRWWLVVFIAAAVFGLILSIAGFLIGRKKAPAAA